MLLVADMKVLFMTGYSRNAIVHQGRLHPGVQLIQKPVTSIELARRIREIFGPSRASDPQANASAR
jgi:hypothetical protein